MKPRAARTEVIRVEKHVVRVVDHLALRVQLRAAELGISFRQVAKRMGINHATLGEHCAGPRISSETLGRLLVALEGDGEWLDRPLPKLRPMSAEKMLEALRRKIR